MSASPHGAVTPGSTPRGAPPAPLFTRGFVFLTLSHFLQALGWASMLIFPLYLDALEASRAEVGVIMAMAGAGGLACRPFVGWALDVLGRRPVIAFGGVVMAIGLAMIWWVEDLGPVVYLQRIVFGVGIGVLFTGYFTLAADLVPPERRTEGIALFGVSGLLPLALNPFVKDLGFEAADLRAFYPIAGGIVLLAMVFLFFVPEPRRDPAAGPFSFRAAAGALSVRRLWPVWFATIVFATMVSVFMAFSAVTAEGRGLARPADLWLPYAVGAVSVRVFGARLPDRIGPSRIIPPALAMYILGMVLCAVATSPAGFLLAGLAAGVGHGYSFPVLMGQVVTRSPGSLRGSAVAMYTALWVVAELGFTPLFGVIADLGSDAAMFLTAAAAAALGLGWWGGQVDPRGGPGPRGGGGGGAHPPPHGLALPSGGGP